MREPQESTNYLPHHLASSERSPLQCSSSCEMQCDLMALSSFQRIRNSAQCSFRLLLEYILVLGAFERTISSISEDVLSRTVLKSMPLMILTILMIIMVC